MKYEDIQIETLQRFLDQSPFIKLLTLKVVSLDVAREELVLSMPMQTTIERASGSQQMHGGALASLIDTAGCFALIMGTMAPVPTINFRVDYLRPAIKTDVIARAQVRRAGKSVGVVDVEVEAENGTLLALGRGAFGL